jgi:DNA segregation ATPase FtsK/SpoIIIE-like protein
MISDVTSNETSAAARGASNTRAYDDDALKAVAKALYTNLILQGQASETCVGEMDADYLTEIDGEIDLRILASAAIRAVEQQYATRPTSAPNANDDPLRLRSAGMTDQQIYPLAVDAVVRELNADISFIQGELQIGFNRASALLERMEREGVVSRPNNYGVRMVWGAPE